jgi:hypothetical protein
LFVMRKSVCYPVLLSLAVLAVPVSGQPDPAPRLTALAKLEPGQWMLRTRGHASETRSICVTDAAILLQPRHGGAACSRFVIANDDRAATVHYTCPGAGHGRTTLRVENPRLIQIESQGIAEKEPFAFDMEGRRTGACPAKVSAVSR